MATDLKTTLDSGEWIGPEHREEYDSLLLECYLKIQKYNTQPVPPDKIGAAIEDITGKEQDPRTVVIFPFRCDLG